MTNKVATVAHVATALEKRSLTGLQADRAQLLLDGLVDTLEIKLNRLLWPREITETHVLRAGGKLILRKHPVRSVTGIVVDGTAVAADDPVLLDHEAGTWPDGVTIVVTYQAGDDVRKAATLAIADVVARTIQAGVAAGSGAIKSYSVEGTSITYGDVADGGAGGTGRLKVGDIRALGRLRMPVLLT